ncbi:MAG: sensor histidine kinase [Cellvibrionaceae bacterium]
MANSAKHSISKQLIKVVFAFYCAIAIAVTGIHIIAEYRYTREAVSKELQSNEVIFGSVLAAALWNLDQEQVDTVLDAVLANPIVTGIKIYQADLLFSAKGVVIENDQVASFGGANGADDQSDTIDRDGLISYDFPVVYNYQGRSTEIGRATVYSSSSVVFDRVQLGFAMLIFNAMIKTMALWFVFLWVGKRVLVNPLNKLTVAIDEVDLDRLDRFSINLESRYKNELTIIEEKFRLMVEKLKQDKVRIDEFNRDLESQVKVRTEELDDARVIAEQANKAKSLFLGRMSHELRTPLNAIIGFSKRQIRIADKDKPEQMKDMAETIFKAGNHLLMLISDIMTYMESEQGKIKVHIQTCQLQKILDDSLDMVDSMADAYGVTLHCRCRDASVLVDPGRMTQVVINLLTNAVKYNRPGGEVIISSEEKGGQLILHVRDTGVGIPESEMHKVFEPFTRLDYAESQAIEGTGIGLALCDFLMNEMGGDIKVQSHLNEGSTFSLTLALAKETLPTAVEGES